MISNGACISKIEKDLEDILNTIIPLTSCLIQPCEEPPPERLQWAQQPFDIITKPDQTVSFTASAIGDGDITYQWYVSKSPYQIIENADSNVHMIESVKKSDEGYYVCEASSSSFTNSITSVAGKLSVAVPPPSFVSDIYTLEGGYQSNTYTFLYMSSAFFEPSLKNTILPMVEDPSRLKILSIPNTTGTGPATIDIPYLEGHARINWNARLILNADGTFTINKKKFDHPFLAKIFDQIVDVYTPSTSLDCLILLSNGDLINQKFQRPDKTGTMKIESPVLIANNIKKIIQKSKSHSLIATVVDNDGNVILINDLKKYSLGLKESEIKAVGASKEAGLFLIKKSEEKSIFKIKPTTTDLGGSIFKADVVLDTSLHTLTATDEIYLDIKCHEVGVCILTNKNIIVTRTFSDGSAGSPFIFTKTVTPFDKGHSIPPHTSYSFKIYGTDNKFYTHTGVLDNFYTPLKDYLDKIKFGTP
jgi:hypothetical protein